MINKVIILGRVGSDPEVKVSAREEKFAGMSVATSEKYKSKQGEWQEKTQWHMIKVFDPRLAETIEKYVHKGTMLYVEGEIEYSKYADSEGNQKTTTEILVPKFSGVIRMVGEKATGSKPAAASSTDSVDDIPF